MKSSDGQLHIQASLRQAFLSTAISKTHRNKSVYTDLAKFAGDLPHRYGNSRAIWITQYYLPPGRGDIPAFTPAEAGTRLSDPGGMQG